MGDDYHPNQKSFDSRYASSLSELISFLGLNDFKEKNRNASLGFEEFIVTPKDLEASQPQYNDAPYIGGISLKSSLFVWGATSFEEYRSTIGLIGPSSGTTEIQTRVHKIIGAQDPKGWHNQLDDYAFIQLSYLKGFRNYEHIFSNEMHLQWFHNYALSFGNYSISAGAGSYLRLGHNIPDNFVSISDSFNSSLSHQLNFKSRSKDLGWAVRAGIFTHIPAYDYINKEAEKRGYDYDRSDLQLLTQIGLDLFMESFQISVEIYPVGSLYKSYREDSWGRIHLTWYD